MSLEWIAEELAGLRRRDWLRELRVRESPHVTGLVQLDGTGLADFGSNDYLGLSADARLVEAVRRAVGEHGWGSAASPLVSGYGVLHRRLEEELACFMETEAAALFTSGFAANVSAITALTGPGDLILSDQLNHASIVDGCRLSRAATVIYRHGDAEHVRALLGERSQFRRVLIVTDGLFSMDGDFAPLPELAALAAEFDCMLMVDEAHAVGVWGASGRGSIELLGVRSGVDVVVGTLSKGLGGIGGFVAGSADLIAWLRNRGRHYLFSTALPAAAAAASLAALGIVKSEPRHREQLQTAVRRVAGQLAGLEVPVQSQIIPVLLGSERKALETAERMRQAGLFVPAIRPPAVPADQCRLRVSLRAGLRPEDTDRLVEVLRQVRADAAFASGAVPGKPVRPSCAGSIQAR